jgi:hypothetical protein
VLTVERPVQSGARTLSVQKGICVRAERVLAGHRAQQNTVPGDKSALRTWRHPAGRPALTSRGFIESDLMLWLSFKTVQDHSSQRTALVFCLVAS